MGNSAHKGHLISKEKEVEQLVDKKKANLPFIRVERI
jgi:hypothetical protein